MKYTVHSWKEVEGTETITETHGEGEAAEEVTFDSPTHEIIEFVSEEFDSLDDAKNSFDSLSDKIRCIFYSCTEQFEGLKPYKHSQTPNAEQEAKADAYIAICIAACEADGDGE
tara:strand:+ start:2527 stop:2868 length:342 start_codon:yes stop_codon:yes gene_type:complete